MAGGGQMTTSLLDQHGLSSGLRTGKAEAISRHLGAALIKGQPLEMACPQEICD
jgi:hypothetical protein